MLYPPRPFLLAKTGVTVGAPKTNLVFQVPDGTNFWLFGFTAKWYPTVVDGVQTGNNLRYALTAMAQPMIEPSNNDFPNPEIALVTTPGVNGVIRGMVPSPRNCSPRSQIIFEVTGIAPATFERLSVTLMGRTGFLVSR